MYLYMYAGAIKIPEYILLLSRAQGYYRSFSSTLKSPEKMVRNGHKFYNWSSSDEKHADDVRHAGTAYTDIFTSIHVCKLNTH